MDTPTGSPSNGDNDALFYTEVEELCGNLGGCLFDMWSGLQRDKSHLNEQRRREFVASARNIGTSIAQFNRNTENL